VSKIVRNGILGGAAVIAVASLAGCNRPQTAQAPTREVAVVERRDLEVRVEATGNIQPIRIIEVKSKASGEVRRVHIESGDQVVPGQLLVEIDPRDVNNAYEQALADRDVAKARLETSKAQKLRTEELRKANVVTAQELESVTLSVANDNAQLIKATTNLKLAEERKNDVTIRAPIAGTVIAESLEVGMVIASASQNVSGGTTLLTMADLSQMQVRTLIDETDLGQIETGMTVNVTVEAYPSRTFTGQVMKIEPQAVVEQNVVMFPVLVYLDNMENLLRPGMNADVQIEVARREGVIAVASAAVVDQRNAAAAGTTLGLKPEAVQAALRGGGSGTASNPELGSPTPGAAPAAEQAAASTNAAGRDGGAARRPAASPECTALRQKLEQSGFDGLSPAEREKLRGDCRLVQVNSGTGANDGAQGMQRSQEGGGGQNARGGQSSDRQSGMSSGRRGGRAGGSGGASSGTRRRQETRTGVVFLTKGGVIEPRRITLGVNDWEYTEVVRGLELGDSVVLISVAQLQAQQEQAAARMRQNMGGFPGTGNPGGAQGPRGPGGGGGSGGGRGGGGRGN
jgi:HlyD family secretion protein